MNTDTQFLEAKSVLSVYTTFLVKTYDKLRQVAGPKISRFVSEAVEEKIQREEQQKEEKFRQELIADYQSVTKNKKIQKEMEIWDETISDMWRIKFDKLKEFSKPFRPCIVVSNDAQNEFDDKIVVVPTTADEIEKIRKFEVLIENTKETGLEKPSKILGNYPHTIYKKLRLIGEKRMGVASPKIMEKVRAALKITLNLGK
ncbi:18397_t:CDS:2 [Funneliformis geosporum]|nr:18397_t:CDS:2 [Funneliformis geosporum]